jgi:acetolactate synthase-1/2/3 large subunit
MMIAQAIAEFFVEKGCTHAFGLVGGGNVTVFDAVSKRMQLVSTHQEQGAAMAACYYYRTCGRIAPVLITSGAGSANAITGVMAAWMDGIPMVVLSGNENRAMLQGRTRILGTQGFMSSDAAKHFTKFSRCAEAVTAMPFLKYGYDLALQRRQGPIWLDIPRDVARENV